MLPEPRNFDRHMLWPWRCWMTIGIGAVCSINKHADCLILASDRLGSYGADFSSKSHGKMFCLNEDRIFAVCADRVQNAGELIPMIREEWSKVPDRNLQIMSGKLVEVTMRYKTLRFCLDVLPNYGIAPSEDWRVVAGKMGILPKILREWRKCSTHCDLIIGTFDERDQAHMYFVDSGGGVALRTLEGFCAIGSGAFGALFWLSYREQNLHMSVQRTAYHVYEAKLMSEQSPYVGKDDISLLVVPAGHGKYYHLTKDCPEVAGCPVSLTRLTEFLKEVGPRPTDALEIV